ncbi:MAG: outer membrane protein assembly factor BamE [Pseudomonadota bacterium]|nr:outer membrane protein assembly factor BamE [Pseudomonadota bacterium]
MRTFRTLAPLCLALLLASCSSGMLESLRVPLVYRVDVQQGNVVTQEMLAQLEAGLDRNKVRYIMGTPLLADVFHQDRWDYVYTQQNGGDTPAQRRVSLYFENDHLARIDGDVKAARAPLIYTPRQEVTIQVPGERKRSLFERLLAGIGLGEDDSDRVADQVNKKEEIELATH